MSLTVPALLTPSAGAPFERGTIERRELRRARRPHRHRLRRHLPLRHPPGARGVGQGHLPDGPRPRDRGRRLGRRVRRHQARRGRPRRRRLLRRLLPRVRDVPGRRGAVLPERATSAPTTPGQYDGSPTYGGYSTQIVVDENYALRIPEGISLDVAAPLLCAGITLYSPLKHWGAGPGRRWPSSAWAGSGTWACSSRTRSAPRSPCSASRCPSRPTASRWAPTTTTRRATRQTFRDLRRSFDLIISTVGADIDVDAYLSLLAVRGVARVRRAAREQAVVPRLLAHRRLVGTCPGPTSAASARPRRCSTSAREHGIGSVDRDDHRRRRRQGLRPRGRQRRPLPLRHRHVDDPGELSPRHLPHSRERHFAARTSCRPAVLAANCRSRRPALRWRGGPHPARRAAARRARDPVAGLAAGQLPALAGARRRRRAAAPARHASRRVRRLVVGRPDRVPDGAVHASSPGRRCRTSATSPRSTSGSTRSTTTAGAACCSGRSRRRAR